MINKILDLWLIILMAIFNIIVTLAPVGLSFLLVNITGSWAGMLFNLSYVFVVPIFIMLWCLWADYIKDATA